MERMGREINPDKLPMKDEAFPLEVQEALIMHSLLPDKWDGTSGSYMGKDWSALSVLLNSYGIEDKRTVIYFLRVIDNFKQISLNERLAKDRKTEEAKRKAPVGSYPKSKK
jgi:hypothetical protein